MYMEMSKSTSIASRALKSSSLVSELQAAAAFMVNPYVGGVGHDFFFFSSADAGDDFSVDVDKFFDLHGCEEDEEGGGEAHDDKTSSNSSSSSSLSLSWSSSSSSSSFSATAHDFSAAPDGLAIPGDEINKELELWSHLMDGALHDDFFTCPTRNPYATTPVRNRVRFEPKVKPAIVVEATRFPPPPFTRPRSKRSRPITGASWSSCSLLEPESSLSSSVSSSPEPGPEKTGVKRMNRSPVEDDGDSVSADGPAQARKCTHCQVEKTPQWRTGPLGPKTLCNACSVRFKSGRLFPEYRPACSPTFSSEVHSNSHRKVVEMRPVQLGDFGLAVIDRWGSCNKFFRGLEM